MGKNGRRLVSRYVFIFGITALAGAGSFFLVYWKLGGSLGFIAKQAETPIIQTTKRPMVRGASRGICDDGFRYFRNSQFSLCYPERLVDIVEKQSPEQTHIIFTEGDEKLTVWLNVAKDWGPHVCNSETDVAVASHSAIRTVFRTDTTSGCGRIHGFATLITTGGKLPLMVRLSKTTGSYSSSSEYLSIEQSLRLYYLDK